MAVEPRRNPGHVVNKADYAYDDELAQGARARDRKARNAYMAAAGGAVSPFSIPVGLVGGAYGQGSDNKVLRNDGYSMAVGGALSPVSFPVGLGRGAYLNHQSYRDNRRAGRPAKSHRQLLEKMVSKALDKDTKSTGGIMDSRPQLTRISKSEGYMLDEGDASNVQCIELVPTGRQAGAAQGLTHVRNSRGKGGPNKLERYRGGGSLSSALTQVGKSSAAGRAAGKAGKRARAMSGDYDGWDVDTLIRNTKDAAKKAKSRKRAAVAGGATAAGGAAGGAGYAASRRKDSE